MMKIKKTIVIRITLFLLVCFNTQAQQEGTKIIDNKGTLKNISKVFSSNATPTPVQNNVEGDIWYDTSASNTTIKIWDDNINNTNIPGWRYLSGNNWLLTGNSNASSTNFLGTINDVRLQLRSNNTPLLELGRRSTLGLPTNIFPDDPVVHIKNGGSTFATIEFEAPNINSHGKPIIRASNDNFVIRSGIRNNDYFRIRSVANTPSDGSLEFEIGDDGNEPFVFISNSNNRGRRELFRAQGSNTSASSKTRFGINTGGIMASSTLQIKGSVGKSILEITSGSGNFDLTEDHHTIIVKTNRTIVLPNANNCEGRIYVIKNVSGNSINTSAYRNESNISSINLVNNKTIWLQSNSTEWVLISSTSKSNISIGDIKHGLQTSNHNGWYLLNGQAISSLPTNAQTAASTLSLGSNLPNATDRVLKHPSGGEVLGDVGGATTTTLSQNNLPNYNLPTATTSTDGNHNHNINYSTGNNGVISFFGSANVLIPGGATTVTSSSNGDHNHTVTVNSGGGNQPFNNYQPYLVVNTFIYLGE